MKHNSGEECIHHYYQLQVASIKNAEVFTPVNRLTMQVYMYDLQVRYNSIQGSRG